MKSRTKRMGVTTAAIVSFFAAASFVFAQTCPTGKICLPNPIAAGDVPSLVNLILQGLFGIVGAVALVIFIYGGFTWMTAQGAEKKIKQGWDTMTWAALGLVVIFGSYILVSFFLQILLKGSPEQGASSSGGAAQPAATQQGGAPAKTPPAKTPPANPKNCGEAGGECKNINTYNCPSGKWQQGLCPGADNIRCCLPK